MWSLESQPDFQDFRLFQSFCKITNHFVSGNIEILGKQNSLVLNGPVIKC